MKSNRENFSSAPRQLRHFSQVFLKELWPAKRMVEIVQNWNANLVLEIGPGDGVLTQELLNAGLDVVAIEKDTRFAERLKDRWQDQGNFKLVEADVLSFPINEWIAEHHGRQIAVVGNIPYNISSPILMWVLPSLSELVGVGLMTQLEFAERLASPPDQKSYGSLSVFTQIRANVEIVCEVPKSVFKPVPKVDSAIVTLQHKPCDLTSVQLRRLETITKAAFSQRRKKLRNGIKAWLNKAGGEEMISVDLERRPGTLSVEEFLGLAREVFPNDF